MRTQTKMYLQKLRAHYSQYEDDDTLSLFDEKEQDFERNTRELQIFREHPRTQEITRDAYSRLRIALEKLTSDDKMSDLDRMKYFVSMDWAKWYLDQLGEDPNKYEQSFDELIKGYAEKAGIA